MLSINLDPQKFICNLLAYLISVYLIEIVLGCGYIPFFFKLPSKTMQILKLAVANVACCLNNINMALFPRLNNYYIQNLRSTLRLYYSNMKILL